MEFLGYEIKAFIRPHAGFIRSSKLSLDCTRSNPMTQTPSWRKPQQWGAKRHSNVPSTVEIAYQGHSGQTIFSVLCDSPHKRKQIAFYFFQAHLRTKYFVSYIRFPSKTKKMHWFSYLGPEKVSFICDCPVYCSITRTLSSAPLVCSSSGQRDGDWEERIRQKNRNWLLYLLAPAERVVWRRGFWSR